MNFQIYFNAKNYFLHAGRVPSPTDHSALFTNSSSIYKVPGALPDFGKTIYMENIAKQNKVHNKIKSSLARS